MDLAVSEGESNSEEEINQQITEIIGTIEITVTTIIDKEEIEIIVIEEDKEDIRHIINIKHFDPA